MTESPEAPSFDVQAFDDSFFTAYEGQLSDVSVGDQASAALAAIVTIEKADGSQKSYDELRDETRTFFASDWVRKDEAVMNRLAMEFAQACMSHSHGAELAQDNRLSSIFEDGMQSLTAKEHSEHRSTDEGDDDDETDPKADKKKRRGARAGWLVMTR
jgi:hypothetical protein